jgi:hypothetical protein
MAWASALRRKRAKPPTSEILSVTIAVIVVGEMHAGLAARFVALADGQPELYPWLRKVLPDMYAKAYRWDAEVLEIYAFLEPGRNAAEMFVGAAQVYRQVAQDDRTGSDAGAVGILKRFSQLAKNA